MPAHPSLLCFVFHFLNKLLKLTLLSLTWIRKVPVKVSRSSFLIAAIQTQTFYLDEDPEMAGNPAPLFWGPNRDIKNVSFQSKSMNFRWKCAKCIFLRQFSLPVGDLIRHRFLARNAIFYKFAAHFKKAGLLLVGRRMLSQLSEPQ
jgi:hypothetical protein